MPDAAAKLQPLSHTEISLRVKGIISEITGVPAHELRDARLFADAIGLRSGGGDAWAFHLLLIFDGIRNAFAIDFDGTNFNLDVMTVAEFIDQAEGAISQKGGIA